MVLMSNVGRSTENKKKTYMKNVHSQIERGAYCCLSSILCFECANCIAVRACNKQQLQLHQRQLQLKQYTQRMYAFLIENESQLQNWFRM